MTSSSNKLSYYLSIKQKFYFFVLLILFVTNSFLEIVSLSSIPVLIGYLLAPNEFLQKIPFENVKIFLSSFLENRSKNEITGMACFFIFLIFVIKNFYSLISYYIELKFHKSVNLSINFRLFKSYLYAPYETHLLTNPSFTTRNLIFSSTASNQIISFVRLIKEILLISGITLLIILFSFDKSLIVIFFIISILFGFFLLISEVVKKKGIKNAINQNEVLKTINQFIGSIIEIKTKGKEEFFFKKYASRVFDFESNNLFVKFVKSCPKMIIEIIAGGSLLLIVFLLTKNYELSTIIPYLALLTLAVVRLLPSVNSIMTCIADIKQQKVYFDLIYNELKKYEFKKDNISKENKELKNIRESIELKDISFKYDSSLEKSISSINLKIKKGKRIGISGESGSGKSTLLKIILGLLKPQEGEILIDGEKISFSSKILWENISYVPQESYILDETIENNIAFGSLNESLEKDKISKIINCTELIELIESSKNGIKTLVGERGIRISGGQKQRIAIARALYSEPDLLFLDESTSNLDLETERKIYQNLKKDYPQMTIISISHRKDAFIEYDSVYFLDKGKLLKN